MAPPSAESARANILILRPSPIPTAPPSANTGISSFVFGNATLPGQTQSSGLIGKLSLQTKSKVIHIVHIKTWQVAGISIHF